jgi:hypothetical protein
MFCTFAFLGTHTNTPNALIHHCNSFISISLSLLSLHRFTASLTLFAANTSINSYAVVSAESFGILSQKDYIPFMTFQAAKLLLQLEKHYHNAASNNMVQEREQSDGSLPLPPPATVNNNNNTLCSCLQERCLKTLLLHHSMINTTTTTAIKSPDYDKTLKILGGTVTLLSTPKHNQVYG